MPSPPNWIPPQWAPAPPVSSVNPPGPPPPLGPGSLGYLPAPPAPSGADENLPDPERYVSVSEMRDEGVTCDLIDDDRLRGLLGRLSDRIEQATALRFYAFPATLDLDGSDTRLLWLTVPIVKLDNLTLNLDPLDPNGSPPGQLDPSRYRVFNHRGWPQDDRRNPKIELYAGRHTVYDGPTYRGRPEGLLVFRKGLTQRLVGTFGWTEPTGRCPEDIRWCIKRLAARDYPQLTDPAFWENRRISKITEERTDGHALRFRGGNTRALQLEAMFDDAEVAQILERYRPPLMMGAAGLPRK